MEIARKMFIVGLTGGIATGKSTVSEVFRKLGVPVVDADQIARQIVEPGQKTWSKLRAEFGDSVFDANGHLDRAKLGDLVFADADKRRRLNEITHPEIQSKLFWATLNCLFQGHQFIVLELPLLFETGSMLDYLHKIVVVSCEPEQQLSRLAERRSQTHEMGMSEQQAKRRIAAQLPLDDKCRRAHFVLDNSGAVEDTRQQAEKVVQLLRTSRAHWKVRGVAAALCAATVAATTYLLVGANVFPSIGL